MIIAYAFIQCANSRMMYTDDTRTVSSTLYITTALEHGNNWWEMSGGKPGTLVNPRHRRATLLNEKLVTRAKG